MNRCPEDDLLTDVFPKAVDFREASLEQMLFCARRKRRRSKMVQQTATLTIGLSLSIFLMIFRKVERSAPQVASIDAHVPGNKLQTIPGTSIRILSDEELLEMFAGRPTALIGPPDDRQFILLDGFRKEK